MGDPVGKVFAILILSIIGLGEICFLAVLLVLHIRHTWERGVDPQDNHERQSVSNESSTGPTVRNQSMMFGLQYDIESFEATTVSLAQTEDIQAQIERKNHIRSKLHYQVVLPDMSNVTIESHCREGAKEDDATTTNVSTDDGDDNSTIAADQLKEESTASSLSLYHRVRDLFSLRSLRPRKKDICSVCLEGFQSGQTICAAKNSCCNHMFHEECIRTWLMENDDCPLCRSNIME